MAKSKECMHALNLGIVIGNIESNLTYACMQQFEVLLQSVAEKVGFENPYKEEPTYPRLAIAAGELIPKAIDKASSPDDYRVINNLLTFKNLYYDYQTITDFGERVTTNSLKHHSVVSFYINRDLWRLVPIVLEGTNWIKLADDYLEERKFIQFQLSSKIARAKNP